MAAHELRDLRVLGDLERLTRDRSADVGGEVRITLARTRDDLAQLLFGELDGLAGNRPPLRLEDAARRIARELLPALDQ